MKLDRAVSLEWNDTRPGSSSWPRGRPAPVKEGRSDDDKEETGGATYCKDLAAKQESKPRRGKQITQSKLEAVNLTEWITRVNRALPATLTR